MTKKTQAYYAIIYEQVSQSKTVPVSDLCKLAGVSRSGYYNWINTQQNRDAREKQDEEDFKLIEEAFHADGHDNGAKGIRKVLLSKGICMNLKKIRRLMKKYHLEYRSPKSKLEATQS